MVVSLDSFGNSRLRGLVLHSIDRIFELTLDEGEFWSRSDWLLYMLAKWRLTLDDAIKGRHGSGLAVYRDRKN